MLYPLKLNGRSHKSRLKWSQELLDPGGVATAMEALEAQRHQLSAAEKRCRGVLKAEWMRRDGVDAVA